MSDTINTTFSKEGREQPEIVSTTPLKTVFLDLFLSKAFEVKIKKGYLRVPSTGFYQKNQGFPVLDILGIPL